MGKAINNTDPQHSDDDEYEYKDISDLEDEANETTQDPKNTKFKKEVSEVTKGLDAAKKKKSKGFQSMGLSYPIYKAVMQKGFKVPTPIQRKVIPLIIEGRDVIACSRTGSGKTAAFIIPMLNKLEKHSSKYGCRALLLLPTREQALQTASNLKQFIKFSDLRYSVIVGGHGFEGQFEAIASNPDILIATPGRLMQLLDETDLSLSKIEYIVFDEADSLFEMGFLPQIRTILNKVSTNRQTMMFSATIPQEVSDFAIAGMRDYAFCRLDNEFTLPDEILQHFFLVRTQEKVPLLVHLFRHIIGKDESTILFTATSYWVDYLVVLLRQFDIEGVGVYGKMDQLARKEQMQRFRTHEVKVLIVTDLVARGIDQPFVDNVINLDFPQQNKLFIHRCGRVARAGKHGTVFNLVGMTELPYFQQVENCLQRPIVNKLQGHEIKCEETGEIESYDKRYCYYGKVDNDNLQTITGMMNAYLKEDEELETLRETSMKSMEKFIRTRGSANITAADGEKKVFSLDLETVHPMFASGVNNTEEGLAMLKRMKNYKPRSSYMELKAFKGKGDVKSEKILKSIIQLKKETQKMKDVRKRELDVELLGKKSHQIMTETNEPENAGIDKDSEGEDCDENEEYEIEIPENQKEAFALEKSLKAADKLQNRRKKLKTDINDYKSKFFISHDADPEMMKEFEDKDKIGFEDLNTMFMTTADSAEDLVKRKKMVWDKKKNNYKQIVVNARGEQLNGGSKFQSNDTTKVAQEKFKKWKHFNQMGFQKQGDEEDAKTAGRARVMFKDRQKNAPFRSEGTYQYKGIYEPVKKIKKESKFAAHDGAMKGIRGSVNSELKDAGAILKIKKLKKNTELKNMVKDKRNKILDDRKKQFGVTQSSFKKGHVLNKPMAKQPTAGMKNRRGAPGINKTGGGSSGGRGGGSSGGGRGGGSSGGRGGGRSGGRGGGSSGGRGGGSSGGRGGGKSGGRGGGKSAKSGGKSGGKGGKGGKR